MTQSRIARFVCIIALTSILVGCNLEIPFIPTVTSPSQEVSTTDVPLATQIPPLAETLVSFRVHIPPNTPPNEMVYLSILDEVTGLALNTTLYPMQAVGASSEITPTRASEVYVITLPFAIGSSIQYRYERQAGSIRVAEHISDSSPVRYRLYHVEGEGTVDDIVSRWTDTPFESSMGRIIGQTLDTDTGQPISNMLITAGGSQTITASDGSFRIEGLPPGVHNLVAYAMDGSYKTFQQGALIAADSTTPTPIEMHKAKPIKVVFVVKVPENTPPIVPLRLAGNLYQLGNTFATLTGGISSLAANMPILSQLPDGRYTVTLELPAGADIRYKYTLGDGYWNAEHDSEGAFRLRQIVVPNENILIEDDVISWFAGESNSIIFDVYVPQETPTEDFISIQFNPLFGWTEPIPMWKLGDNRWAYALFSPLNLPGNFSYRYCRNGQCGYADDIQTAGLYGQGRPVMIGSEPQTMQDSVSAWTNWSAAPVAFEIPTATVLTRGPDYWAGIEFISSYHPSWKSLMPKSLDQVQKTGNNWLVIAPTWTFGKSSPGNNPPILELVPGKDPMWLDLLDTAQNVQDRGLKLALNPSPNFLVPAEEWWQSAPRDFSWWQQWFEQYRAFILHHADLATQTNSSALILGGAWIEPALPGGVLADGNPSGVPEDAETRWRNILVEVKNRYKGNLVWAIPGTEIMQPPPFLDLVDLVYVQIKFYAGADAYTDLGADVNSWLDYTAWPFQILLGKPLILAIEYPSDPDSQIQFDGYNTVLNAANQRDWINGFVSRGFFPPVALQDLTPSINGKPTSDLLGYWFPLILGTTSP